MILTPDQRLRVFVSSTTGELTEERHAAERAVSALRLTPMLFELGARPHPPRELYRAYLAQSDIFIGLYWQRYGQVDAGMEVSALEDEVELARARGLPCLLYVKTPAPDREPRLAELLDHIKQEASYRRFQTPAELGRLVRDDLATLLSERFAARPSRPASSARSRGPRPLPAATTSLVGREQAIEEVAGVLGRPGVRLVTLALVQGRLDDAWELLDEGLDLSLASYSTRNVTLYLAAFAQLALAEGDAEQAALLAGAADGLRRRVGLGVWPLLRRGEAELVAQIRQALGADRFDEVFAAGARLNQPEAVAAVRDRHGATAS